MTHRVESSLEATFHRRVRLLGGMVVKLAPTVKGLPDRLVLLPGGQVYLVELKTDRGRPSPAQLVWHHRARELGTEVHVLYGPEQIDAWIKARYAELDEDREKRNRTWKRQQAALKRAANKSASVSG